MALTQVPSSMLANSGAELGMRNRIINGDMRIDQRNSGAATTLTNGSLTYNVDRWAGLVSSATSTVTLQRVSSGLSATPYALRILRGSGTFTGGYWVTQAIETNNCQDLAGQQITISYYARAGSAYSGGTVNLQINTGTGSDQGAYGGYSGSWTGWATQSAASITPTTSFVRYTATFTVPSGVNELSISFAASFSGTGSANDYLDITGVQLEKGSTATPFEYRPYGAELALCQRYYEIIGSSTGSFLVGAGTVALGNETDYVFRYAVTKRSAPTLTVVGTWTYSNTNAANAYPVVPSIDCFVYVLTATSAGRVYAQNNSAGAYITANSEL